MISEVQHPLPTCITSWLSKHWVESSQYAQYANYATALTNPISRTLAEATQINAEDYFLINSN